LQKKLFLRPRKKKKGKKSLLDPGKNGRANLNDMIDGKERGKKKKREDIPSKSLKEGTFPAGAFRTWGKEKERKKGKGGAALFFPNEQGGGKEKKGTIGFFSSKEKKERKGKKRGRL